MSAVFCLLANVNPSLLTFEVIIYNFSYQSGPSTIFLNPFMPYAPLSISENSESRKINKFLSVIRCLNEHISNELPEINPDTWGVIWEIGRINKLYWCYIDVLKVGHTERRLSSGITDWSIISSDYVPLQNLSNLDKCETQTLLRITHFYRMKSIWSMEREISLPVQLLQCHWQLYIRV